MRPWRVLACIGALLVSACGRGREGAPPSGASYEAWCTKTVAGTLRSCVFLRASAPEFSDWVLNFLRERTFAPQPVEVSTFLHITVDREEQPPAP
jgi:hypothetical protein